MNLKIKTENDKKAVKQVIDRLDLTVSKTYHISISVKRGIRTISQNGLYWLWVTCIVQETGNDKKTIHEYFKQEFLGWEIKEVFGTEVTQLRSTTSLNTKQFADFLNKVEVFASTELEITLPRPEDVKFKEFYDHYKDYL